MFKHAVTKCTIKGGWDEESTGKQTNIFRKTQNTKTKPNLENNSTRGERAAIELSADRRRSIHTHML